MYLRINRAATKPGTKDAQTEIYKEKMAKLQSIPGFRTLFAFSDDEKNTGGSIALWEDKESCERSFTSDIRREIIEALQPTLAGDVSAEMYEVTVTSRSIMEERLREGYLAFNDRDFDKLTANGAEDVEIIDVPSGVTSHGREAARKHAERWAGGFPDATIEIVSLALLGDTAVVEFIGCGTHTGTLSTPAGDIPPTGRKVETSFCDVNTLRNGKIVRQRSYYDVASLMQQLGLMPSMEAVGASS